MNPTEEGRRAFMEKLPKDACPYEGKAAIEWKIGYMKQEYQELKQEQHELLNSQSRTEDPHTYLDEFLNRLRKKLDQYNGLLRKRDLI
jgi:hypothetical protein